jgi:hypothetical protein
MTPTLREQTAAKLLLEPFRRGDRVTVTRAPGADPEPMTVAGRIRNDFATIGEARITVRRPGDRTPYTITAAQVANGLTIEPACRACGGEADGTCVICDLPVCDEHCGSRDYNRHCQPPCAA